MVDSVGSDFTFYHCFLIRSDSDVNSNLLITFYHSLFLHIHSLFSCFPFNFLFISCFLFHFIVVLVLFVS